MPQIRIFEMFRKYLCHCHDGRLIGVSSSSETGLPSKQDVFRSYMSSEYFVDVMSLGLVKPSVTEMPECEYLSTQLVGAEMKCQAEELR
jgi:hypothetical protein